MRLTPSGWLAYCLLAPAFMAGCELPDPSDGDGDDVALLRGRVVAADGSSPKRLTVLVGDETVRTDADGRFEVELTPGKKQQVRVESDDFTGGQAEVQVGKGGTVSLEIGVMRMGRLPLPDAAKGGTVRDDRTGFELEIPADALTRPDGKPARGEAQVRFAVVDDPQLVRVPPELRGRDEDARRVRLDALGMIDVRFFQKDERLAFEGEARARVPLPDGVQRDDGDEISLYHYDEEGAGWTWEGRAQVRQGAWEARLDRFSWWTAAEEVARTGCLRLQASAGGRSAANSLLSAAGTESLWLSTATTDDDGEACIEVPRGTQVALSIPWSDGDAVATWVEVVETPDTTGSCGGDTSACLDLDSLDLDARSGDSTGDVTPSGASDASSGMAGAFDASAGLGDGSVATIQCGVRECSGLNSVGVEFAPCCTDSGECGYDSTLLGLGLGCATMAELTESLLGTLDAGTGGGDASTTGGTSGVVGPECDALALGVQSSFPEAVGCCMPDGRCGIATTPDGECVDVGSVLGMPIPCSQ